MTSVERKMMLSHVMKAMKLFLTMNIDVNNLSAAGNYIIYGVIFACLHLHGI